MIAQWAFAGLSVALQTPEQDREFLEKKELTPFDIVDLLKSDDGDDRATALNWLYPGETVAMVRHLHATGQNGMATNKTVYLAGLFTSLCWAAQHVGAALGMRLAWVGKPADDKKIVVPSGVIHPGG